MAKAMNSNGYSSHSTAKLNPHTTSHKKSRKFANHLRDARISCLTLQSMRTAVYRTLLRWQPNYSATTGSIFMTPFLSATCSEHMHTQVKYNASQLSGTCRARAAHLISTGAPPLPAFCWSSRFFNLATSEPCLPCLQESHWARTQPLGAKKEKWANPLCFLAWLASPPPSALFRAKHCSCL